MSTQSPKASELLPPTIAPKGAAPPAIVFTLAADKPSEKELRLVRIVHSSVMVQWGHDTLLTDPWFSQKGSFPGEWIDSDASTRWSS